MSKVMLTEEWIRNNRTSQRTKDIPDKGCPGLFIRAGPSGVVTFYVWENVHEVGKVKRTRKNLGHFGDVSLAEARGKVNASRDTRRIPGSPLTVSQLAERYRTNVLVPNRETADEVWKVIKQGIIEAQPDPARPPFGEWPAREVRPPEVANLVWAAKVKRVVGSHSRGGPGTARVVLREAKSLFAHGVGTGVLDFSPAGTLQSRAFGIGATARSRWLNADEIRALFESLDFNALLDGTAKRQRLSGTVRLSIAFQLYTPLRTQSIIGARWSEFEDDRWVVPVERLKLRKKDRAHARPFVVPLCRTALTILERLRELAGTSPWVLASPKPGRPTAHVDERALVRALARLQRGDRLNLGQHTTVHDLRRTWRTWAQDLGVPNDVARLSLGHAGLEGVEGVYGRSQMVEQRAQAAEYVGAVLDRIRHGEEATVVPLAEIRPPAIGVIPTMRTADV